MILQYHARQITIFINTVAQFLVSITNIQYSLFKSNVIRTVII